MIDIKIMLIQDILPLSSIDIAPRVTPLSLAIVGERLNQAGQVLINDIPAPEFIVLAPTSLIAQVPTSERARAIRKVTVLATVPSTSRSSVIHFDVGPTIRGLRGIEKLVQTFCKLLMQTPGTDRFNPSAGGGLQSVIGQSVTGGASAALAASIVHAVSITADQLIKRQNQNPHIPTDEKLLTAIVTRTGFDPANTLLAATVNLTAVSGRQAVANLTW
jgi:hypothetical protein